MSYAKLQIGCLLLVLFLDFVYFKSLSSKKVHGNRYYIALLIISPIAIFFDGLTAITVNYLSAGILNKIFHLLFFIMMELCVYFLYLYLIDKTIGLPKSKFKKIALSIPMIFSVLTAIAFIYQLEFMKGKNTYYSMGVSVIVGYVSVIIHYIIVLLLTAYKHKTIEKRKFSLFLISLCASFIILIIQTIYKEALISALFPTIMVIGLYVSIEDPLIYQLEQYNKEMVMSFSVLVEGRDSSTGGHIKRTKEYYSIIVNKMMEEKKFAKILTKDYVEDIINASPMHDIGKISTPDYILQKPGRLTSEEYEIIKQHAPKGGQIIKETFKDIKDKEFLEIAYEEARYHHEKWNGKGYPDGLKKVKYLFMLELWRLRMYLMR